MENSKDKCVKILDEILNIRKKQLSLGFTDEHDDKHTKDELIRAAICYALIDTTNIESNEINTAHVIYNMMVEGVSNVWPWDVHWWRPEVNRRDNMLKAVALMVAEIQRMDRQNVSNQP